MIAGAALALFWALIAMMGAMGGFLIIMTIRGG